MKITSSKPDKPRPARITEWTAPTGRKLIPGTEMKVLGKPGKWIFLAYVDHPTAPHVEAKKAGKGQGNIRCFDPEFIYEVSNAKGGKS